MIKAKQSLREFGEELRLDARCDRGSLAECDFHCRGVPTFEGNTSTKRGPHLGCDGGVRDGVKEPFGKFNVLHLQRRLGGVDTARIRIGGVCRVRNCCIEILPCSHGVIESDSRLGAHDEEHRILFSLFYGQRLERVFRLARIELRLREPCERVRISIVQIASALKVLFAAHVSAPLAPQIGSQDQKPHGERVIISDSFERVARELLCLDAVFARVILFTQRR